MHGQHRASPAGRASTTGLSERKATPPRPVWCMPLFGVPLIWATSRSPWMSTPALPLMGRATLSVPIDLGKDGADLDVQIGRDSMISGERPRPPRAKPERAARDGACRYRSGETKTSSRIPLPVFVSPLPYRQASILKVPSAVSDPGPFSRVNFFGSIFAASDTSDGLGISMCPHLKVRRTLSMRRCGNIRRRITG